MQTELEAKFLDIDPEKLRLLLKQHGATMIHAERLMRRRNFDFLDRSLYKVGGWIRVRDEGDKITLSYKLTVDDTLHGTKEILLVVDDFDKATELLLALGLYQKSYQETKRERWELDGVEVTIDTWPWIPAFIELEGRSEKDLKEVSVKLDLAWETAMHGGVAPVYCRYYDITCDEINECENATFSPAPDWLAARKKK